MPPAENYDDERHRKEEIDRRERRRASKSHKSDARREKERKRKAHTQKILEEHAGDRKRSKSPAPPPPAKRSKFQELFAQRAQGFQIDFKFRNAPPRPPVGPCFVGNGLEGVLHDISQYKPLNAVEVNYSWKLHSEPDLGVPLAPSAMDPKLYKPSTGTPTLHPDDENLLNWKGSLGDTAAEQLKKRRDYARAAARLALAGKSPSKFLEKTKSPVASSATKRKNFSRVLDEKMQSWMKKTTYLSNDYSRKVHDFKSLAKTKEELERDLEVRHQEISQRRSATAITQTFAECKRAVTKHPNKRNLKPVCEMPFLPNVEHWGNPYTHVVFDKVPREKIDKAFVANVNRQDANSRMTCQLFAPSTASSESEFMPIRQYELDVLPLKEEDTPHFNFCIWIDSAAEVATYLPISSRIQLSGGRPTKKRNHIMKINRRAMNEEEKQEADERVAEVDLDVEKKLNPSTASSKMAVDSDSDSDDGLLGNTGKTIVAD